MSFSIEGQTAIVTGAASGIGLAIGRHFADQGAKVMFADSDEAKLKHELGDLAEDSNIAYFAGDLQQKLAIANLLSATIDNFDRVDILVNGCRQITHSDPLDPEKDAVEEMFSENVMTSLRLSQAVAKRMMKQAEGKPERHAGSIINLSSIVAHRSHPRLLGYSMAIGALDQVTRTLALALADHRIRVNAVAIGSVMSASLQEALKDSPDYRGDIEQHTPLGRIAGPGELAEAVQYLASEGASFMTGQILTVDGGRTLLDPVAVPSH